MSKNEKRAHPRVASGSLVRFRDAKLPGAGYREGLLENVSVGGLFLSTSRALPEGTQVEIEFELPRGGESSRRIEAVALVKWRRVRFDPPGMGLEFEEFRGKGKELLSEWLGLARGH